MHSEEYHLEFFCFVSPKFEVGNKFVPKIGIRSYHNCGVGDGISCVCGISCIIGSDPPNHVALLAFLTIFFPSHDLNNK